MRLAVAVLSASLILLPAGAVADTSAHPSAADIAKALAEQGAPVRAADIRVGRCVGPNEEPTEFECTWSQRSGKVWRKAKTWFAVDGEGWHVIDWPPQRAN